MITTTWARAVQRLPSRAAIVTNTPVARVAARSVSRACSPNVRISPPTTDLLNGRGMMGDGVIDLPLIRSWMGAAGYRGFHEVKIFSARNW